MMSRDPESGLNCDLRLITGRMAQTLDTYEVKTAKLAQQHIQDVEDQLDDIDNPKLKVQIKQVLEDYKVRSRSRCPYSFLVQCHIEHLLDLNSRP